MSRYLGDVRMQVSGRANAVGAKCALARVALASTVQQVYDIEPNANLQR